MFQRVLLQPKGMVNLGTLNIHGKFNHPKGNTDPLERDLHHESKWVLLWIDSSYPDGKYPINWTHTHLHHIFALRRPDHPVHSVIFANLRHNDPKKLVTVISPFTLLVTAICLFFFNRKIRGDGEIWWCSGACFTTLLRRLLCRWTTTLDTNRKDVDRRS